jgi:hypothetical protein
MVNIQTKQILTTQRRTRAGRKGNILEALLLAELEVLDALPAQFGGDELAEEALHEAAGHEHATGGLLVGASLDSLRNKGDPRVEDAILETTKGLTKGHIADDVECGEVFFVR